VQATTTTTAKRGVWALAFAALIALAGKNTSGRYSFTYWAADEGGLKDPATVTVGVRNR
jgi:hypothetical protein